MVVASHFSPEAFDSLPQEGISVVESSGNCKIVASPLFINISGQKSMQMKEAKTSAYDLKSSTLKVSGCFASLKNGCSDGTNTSSGGHPSGI